MHIPSGFLKPEIWAPCAGISAAGVGYALKKAEELTDEKRTPVIGVMAAFIFAAQMINFPVTGGTSGHLLGSALAVAVLGLWPGMLAMSAVVILQALLFQDGGIEVLGANVLNMAILGTLVSAFVINYADGRSPKVYYSLVAVAGWLSVETSAVVCAVELGLSRTSPLIVVVPVMAGIHAIIGIFEGIITVIALRFILRVKPGIAVHSPGGGEL